MKLERFEIGPVVYYEVYVPWWKQLLLFLKGKTTAEWEVIEVNQEEGSVTVRLIK